MLVAATLPGFGPTFLDHRFVPMVEAFIRHAAGRGVALHFNSAYRCPARQTALRSDPTAITPAELSLHCCGFAVDVNFASLRDRDGLSGDAQRRIIREAAQAAGMGWGGDFETPDPPHFYFDPGVDRRMLIAQAAAQFQALAARASQPPDGIAALAAPPFPTMKNGATHVS